jgi:hypothetical protein
LDLKFTGDKASYPALPQRLVLRLIFTGSCFIAKPASLVPAGRTGVVKGGQEKVTNGERLASKAYHASPKQL